MVNLEAKNLRRGPWLEKEDEILTTIVKSLGEKRWDALAKESGLRRSGKSCRLRWMNYLRPNLKHGEITQEEETIILDLYKQWGSKWSKIAKRLPGRTDNEIKNYWRSHLNKKSDAKQDTKVNDNQDYAIPELMNRNEGTLGISLSETSDLFSNMNALGNESPYESRISEWMTSFHGVNYVIRHDEDCMGSYTYPCFYQFGTNSEESNSWDLWNPI